MVKAYLFSIYHWIIFFVLGTLAWILLMLLPSSFAQKTVRRATKALYSLSFIPIIIKGRSHLDYINKKTLIVVNHSSYLDSLILFFLLPMDITFIAKDELTQHFYTRIPLSKLGIHFVQRHDLSKSLKDLQTLSRYQDIRPLIFFPEGTFTRVPGLRPFHMGAFSLAVQKDLHIIPISLSGTRSILRENSWFIHKGEIGINIGKTTHLTKQESSLSQWDQALILSKKSRKFILLYSKEPDLVFE